jgi:phosphohistidine phosphatase SixA
MCRCTETVEIAFGEYLTDPELRQKSPEDIPGQDAYQAKANELLRMYRGSTPIAFVNHRPNIDSLTMELVGIGELLIGTVTEDGEIEILGKIRVNP